MNSSQSSPELSVILPTRNRESLLGGAIDSLTDQSLPKDRYEIIVVDNGSNDGTQALVKSYIKRFPGLIRLVNESKTGLSRAKNAGVLACQSPVIAFFDDDARARPEWLKEIASCFHDQRVGAAGGAIELEWTCEQPPWWDETLNGAMGEVSYGDTPVKISYPQIPYGSNFAVSRRAFSKVGLFRESLGRKGGNLMAGEDTELCLRITQAGYEVLFNPRAIITHLVSCGRANKNHIRRQKYWHARSRRRLEVMNGLPLETSLPAMTYGLLKSSGQYLINHRSDFIRQLHLINYFGYYLEAINLFFLSPTLTSPPSYEDRR